MLGREGPSIQLGAVGGKGIAKWLKSSPVEERSLIASGAAAGLAAAFNAPIAGLLFVVEEVYHHFHAFLGLNSSSKSRSKFCFSSHIWPNTRTGYARQYPTHDPRPVLDLPPYGSFSWTIWFSL